jgi:drug/metabolite transporter (DMT)-like permease
VNQPIGETSQDALPSSQSPFTRRLISGGIVFLGAVMFSAKAIMVKLAMPYGIDAVPLLLLRMIFALPFYVAILLWIYRKEPERVAIKSSLPKVICLGMIGYYLASYFDFAGLAYITASLERVILYLYPTMVLLISAVFLKKKITSHQWIAIALCYVGVFVAVRYGQPHQETIQSHYHWHGVVLIFLSAVTYALYLVGSGEMIPKLGVWVFTSYAMIVSAICICVHFLISTSVSDLFNYPWQVYAYGFAMATFSTVIPTLLISEGIKRIGASNAAIIGGVGPISTIVLASIFLDETFSMPQLLGTLLVIGGVVYISVKMKQP